MLLRHKLMGAVCAAPLLALSAGAGLAAPIAKHCGPKDKYVIGFSQANYAEPYRQHVNNDLIERVEGDPAIRTADRRRRRQRQHPDVAGR